MTRTIKTVEEELELANRLMELKAENRSFEGYNEISEIAFDLSVELNLLTKEQDKAKSQITEKALELIDEKMLDINHYDTEAMDAQDYEREFKEIFQTLQIAKIALKGGK